MLAMQIALMSCRSLGENPGAGFQWDPQSPLSLFATRFGPGLNSRDVSIDDAVVCFPPFTMAPPGTLLFVKIDGMSWYTMHAQTWSFLAITIGTGGTVLAIEDSINKKNNALFWHYRGYR